MLPSPASSARAAGVNYWGALSEHSHAMVIDVGMAVASWQRGIFLFIYF